MTVSHMIIHYPGGAKQIIRPCQGFSGIWQTLAEAIARPHYPDNVRIKYELK